MRLKESNEEESDEADKNTDRLEADDERGTRDRVQLRNDLRHCQIQKSPHDDAQDPADARLIDAAHRETDDSAREERHARAEVHK